MMVTRNVLDGNRDPNLIHILRHGIPELSIVLKDEEISSFGEELISVILTQIEGCFAHRQVNWRVSGLKISMRAL